MQTENNHFYDVLFTEEFDNCLDHIQDFFAEQGDETLNWWYLREVKLINHLEQLLSRQLDNSLKEEALKTCAELFMGKVLMSC